MSPKALLKKKKNNNNREIRNLRRAHLALEEAGKVESQYLILIRIIAYFSFNLPNSLAITDASVNGKEKPYKFSALRVPFQ